MRPIHFAAIDAGSNAIRLLIVRAYGPERLEVLERQRIGVRLGHHVFTHREFDEETVVEAVRAFKGFKKAFERFNVERYRAVATSASRTARNRQWLLESIFSETGIELEVISTAEEERLVRLAVLSSLPPMQWPEMIFDLGGGSLEMCFLHQGKPVRKAGLPIGTVRLLERFGLQDENGRIDPTQHARIVARVQRRLAKAFPQKPLLTNPLTVACGGNSESLAELAPGKRYHNLKVIKVAALRRMLPKIMEWSVEKRMKVFGVRRDRAEVMAIAAVVYDTIADWLGLENLVAAGVGVREGAIIDQVQAYYGNWPLDQESRGQVILGEARRLARRYHAHMPHVEHVNRLASSLFDQLRPLHGLDAHLKLILEAAALLHDIGHFIADRDHHKHGEYLILNSDIIGLEGPLRDMVALVVRYHRKTDPQTSHKIFGALDSKQQRQLRLLTGILRVAEGLDGDHLQTIERLRLRIDRGHVTVNTLRKGPARESLKRAKEKARLLEKQLGVRMDFR